MKLSLFLVTVLALPTVGASAHAKASVSHSSFKGSQAATSFSSTTPLTCADGSAGTATAAGSISGSDQISKTSGSPRTFNDGIFVELFFYQNSCTGTSFGFGDGGISGGYTPPNNRLVSAKLVGTASVQDFNTGSSVAIKLDLSILGNGPITGEKNHTVTKTVNGPGGPVTIEVTRSADASRTGIVTGTLTIDGVELDAQFSDTSLSFNASSDTTVTKN